MKKIYGLLMVPVLALSGCVSKISKEEGIKRAQEIQKHELDVSGIEALRFENTDNMLADIKQDKDKLYYKNNSHSIYEFSREKLFFHSLVNTDYVYEGEGMKYTDKGETENWTYVKEGVLVSATRLVDEKGKETKSYTEVKTGEKGFKVALDAMLLIAVPKLAAKDDLSFVEEALKQTEEDAKKEGMKYNVKVYSGGEGSLVLKGKAEVTKYNGIEGTGSATFKYVWDEYILKEVSASMKAEAKDEAKKATGKVETSEKTTFAKRCKVAYPDLKGYKKA